MPLQRLKCAEATNARFPSPATCSFEVSHSLRAFLLCTSPGPCFMPLTLLGFPPFRVSHRSRPDFSCVSTIEATPLVSLDTPSEFSVPLVGALLVLPSPSGLCRERLSCRVFLREHSKKPKSPAPLLRFTCSSKINREQLPEYRENFFSKPSGSSHRLLGPFSTFGTQKQLSASLPHLLRYPFRVSHPLRVFLL